MRSTVEFLTRAEILTTYISGHVDAVNEVEREQVHNFG